MEEKEKKFLEKLKGKTNFVSYVIFSNNDFDKNEIFLNLKNDYKIKVNQDSNYYLEKEKIVFFEIDNSAIIIEHIEKPIEEEIRDINLFVKNEELKSKIMKSPSYIKIQAISNESSVLLALLHTKIVSSVLKNNFATSVFHYQDVFEKNSFLYYMNESMKEDTLPIALFVKIFFVKVFGKIIANTMGMKNFSHKEIEVSNLEKYTQDEIINLIDSLVYFSIDNNIDFQDEETFTIKSMKDKFDNIKLEVGKSCISSDEEVVKIKL